MKTIAVASGKGGTGKTTISVALAKSFAAKGRSITFLDADAEEPNAHLFLDIHDFNIEEVSVLVPKLNESLCTGCGTCREVCAYNAIVMIADRPLIYTELCHGCNACIMLCEENALEEDKEIVGQLESCMTQGINFTGGRLKVGSVMTVPVIRALVKKQSEPLTIIDAPPGTSCPVIAATQNVDYVLLVTEPTPFGFNDLVLAIEMLKEIKVKFGVIINRSDLGDKQVFEYCSKNSIPIIAEIPFDVEIAKAYAGGKSLYDIKPDLIDNLALNIEKLVGD